MDQTTGCFFRKKEYTTEWRVVIYRRGEIMAKRILVSIAVVSALVGLLISCTLSGMSDVEFAKELMVESTDATGLYDTSAGSKSGGSTGEGLTIQIDLPDGNPPDTGPYIVTFTFDDFTPGFAPNSLVNGVLTATITLDLDNELVTIVFDGDLTVAGEHSGEYIYDAVLVIDLSTGEYTYSGDIVIDDKVYKTD